ncbi:hypothetical protein EC973_004867 [Apophysomyces ossiformis]|uniref:Uncharacterized protein n=1 Tax=Apophysomyces ossiformis TaxID=679940 RepID=A0A8H7BKS4_9FUNG|nr:hypothetical protein EC973_004867 [Apophysomyces ossiformis]
MNHPLPQRQNVRTCLRYASHHLTRLRSEFRAKLSGTSDIDYEDSSSSDDDDRASQLTYLPELVAHKECRQYNSCSRANHGDKAFDPQQTKDHVLPRIRHWYPSFAMASQYLFPAKTQEPSIVIQQTFLENPPDEEDDYSSYDEVDDDDDDEETEEGENEEEMIQPCRHARPTTAFLVSLSPSAAAAASAARMRRWKARKPKEATLT